MKYNFTNLYQRQRKIKSWGRHHYIGNPLGGGGFDLFFFENNMVVDVYCLAPSFIFKFLNFLERFILFINRSLVKKILFYKEND